MAHTPGPWFLVSEDKPLEEDGAILRSCNGQEIRPAPGVKLGDETDDLRLTCAAPTLLKALLALRDYNNQDGVEQPKTEWLVSEAIREATGRPV